MLHQDVDESTVTTAKIFDRTTIPAASAIGASTIRNKDTSDTSGTTSITGAAVTAVFESSRDILPQQYSGGATHYNEIDTAADRDARSILERNLKLQEDAAANGDNIYRGLGAYKSYNKKDAAQISANKVTG